MLLDFEESQLVLVDYQAKLMPAIFEGPQVLKNAITLAKIAKMMQITRTTEDECKFADGVTGKDANSVKSLPCV